jgi:hypothetical protein
MGVVEWWFDKFSIGSTQGQLCLTRGKCILKIVMCYIMASCKCFLKCKWIYYIYLLTIGTYL